MTCEMQGCEKPATHYGGYAGANDWAGRVCEEHADQLAWSEVLPTVDQILDKWESWR